MCAFVIPVLRMQDDGAAARPAAVPSGMIGRIVASSDGPRAAIPATAWVSATTAEAAALEQLEGRHPLALAHYANHPPAGAAPNAAIASFNFSLRSLGGDGSSSSGGDGGGSSVDCSMSPTDHHHSSEAGGSSSTPPGPWLRAYVPNLDYTAECDAHYLLSKVCLMLGL